MKITIEPADELLIAAKKRAFETRTTLQALLERGLRRELIEGRGTRPQPPQRRNFLWVTAKGGLPPGLDIAGRAYMYEWFPCRQ